jgi:hypothetical protein
MHINKINNMKKENLIAVILAISFYSYSQENKNRFMIKGDVRYSGSNDRSSHNLDTYHNNHLSGHSSAGINLGYFVSNNFAIGLLGSIGKSSSGSTSNSATPYSYEFTSTYSYTGGGIFARYNQVLPTGKLGFFLQLNTSYSKGYANDASTYLDQMGQLISTKGYSKSKEANVSLNPGIIYFINSKFSVESTLGSVYYRASKSKHDDIDFTQASGFGAGFSLKTINLGFSYYFGGKKA